MNWPDLNPYQVGNNIIDDRYFFDREKEMAEILELIDSRSGNIHLVEGARRTGKSSLLMKCKRAIESSRAVALIDFSVFSFNRSVEGDLIPLKAGEILDKIVSEIAEKWCRSLNTTLPAAHAGTTPREFHERLVGPLAALRSGQPLILLIDETEVLRSKSYPSLEELIYSIRECGPDELQAVISEGRDLGEPIPTALRNLLKSALPVTVGPFDESRIPELLQPAYPVTFDTAAAAAVCEESGGHPLLFCALAARLFRTRKDRNEPGPVTAGEVRAIAQDNEVLQKLSSHLRWIWNQVTPLQSRMARVIADLTWREEEARFDSWVDFEAIRVAMSTGTFGYGIPELKEAADHLGKNHVLRVENSRCGLFAPLFGYWLRSVSSGDLTTSADSAAVSEAKFALDAMKADDLPRARRHILLALQRDGTNAQANQLAGEIAEKEGDYESALSYLKAAAQLQPSLLPSFVSFLRRRIESADAPGQPVEVWYQELWSVSKNDALAAEVQGARFLHARTCWLTAFRDGEISASFSIFSVILSMIEDRNPAADGQRRGLFSALDVMIKGQLGSHDALRRGFSLLVACFVPLTRILDEPWEAELESDLLRDFADDPAKLARIRGRFEQKRSAPWWDSAVRLLDLAIARRVVWQDQADELVTVLRHFFQFAPAAARNEVERLCVKHLPELLSDLLGKAWEPAVDVIVLLCELNERPDVLVDVAMDEFVKEMCREETSDEQVIDCIRSLVNIYSPWIGALPAAFADDVLQQVERLIQRFHKKQAGKPKPDSWDLIVAAGPAYRDWISLLGHTFFSSTPSAKQLIDRMTPPPAVAAHIRGGRPDSSKWDTEIADLLGTQYEFCRPSLFRPHGIAGDHLRYYDTIWKGEEIQLKVYRFDRVKQGTADLLEYLWQNERRTLQNLTSHRTGRSLVQFRFVDSRFESKGIRVIATESTGDLDLRRALAQHGHLFEDKEKVWREVHRLIESVAVMHRLNHLHRAIRPENIFVQIDKDRSDFHLKLANFEWSVYLHELQGRHHERDQLDYYSAPEVLASKFGKESQVRGVSFSADIYALGLTLFEILVAQIPRAEMPPLRESAEYDPMRHRQWLTSLRGQIDKRFERSDIIRLTLRSMIEPQPGLRCADLSEVTDDIARFAAEASRVHQLLHDPANRLLMVTTTYRSELGTSSIYHFLNRLRPDLAAEFGATQDELQRFLEAELGGAQVYNAGTSLLYIKGKRFAFVSDRFNWDDPSRKGRSFQLDIPYFRVAGPLDHQEGPLLATLGRVEVVDPKIARKRLESEYQQTINRSQAWGLLHRMALDSRDAGDWKQRQFHTLLRLTGQAEEALWQKQVIPYELVGTDTQGNAMTVRIKADLKARRVEEQNLESLGRFVNRQIARDDPYFELLKSNDPMTTSDEGLPWLFIKSDSETGEIELRRHQNSAPPQFGNIRPLSLAGSRAVHQRRQDLLRILEDDSYLLRAVTDLPSVRTSEPCQELMDGDFLDKELDADKKRIVNRVLGEPPLFLVQGPPGTGKTTLAAEIVRQVLRKRPSARILVVSQAHDPLDNLLSRIDEAYKTATKNRPQPTSVDAHAATDKSTWREGTNRGLAQDSPTMIRLLSDSRLRARTRSDESKAVHKFLPSEVALRALTMPPKAPAAGSRVNERLLSEWRSFREKHRRSLVRSLEDQFINSANLVFATANDKRLSELPVDRTFDLLIFEEAARAYPLEVLGAMRSARRWLLIGDHQQLSPFALVDFQHELDLLIDKHFEWNPDADKTGWDRAVADFFRFLYDGDGLGMKDENKPKAILETQWRMHPEIGNLMADVYYPTMKNGNDGELRATRRHTFKDPHELENQPLVWINTRTMKEDRLTRERPVAGGGYVNHYEIAVIRNLIKRLQQGNSLVDRLVFLSPYRAQVQQLNRTFREWKNPTTGKIGELADRAFTIDSYQGRQEDVVIVSLVRNNEESSALGAYGFLWGEDGRARTGVMCSRAQRLLIVVGSKQHFRRLQKEAGDKGFHLARVADFIDCDFQARSLLTKYDDEFLRKQLKEDLEVELDEAGGSDE